MSKTLCSRLAGLFLGLAMAFAFAPAGAQTGAAPPPCFPLVNGVHPIGPRAVLGEVGVHVFWFCSPRVDQAAKEYGFSVPMSLVENWQALNAAVAEISRASAKLSTAQRLYAEAFTYQCVQVAQEQTARGALCRDRQRVFNANAAKWAKE